MKKREKTSRMDRRKNGRAAVCMAGMCGALLCLGGCTGQTADSVTQIQEAGSLRVAICTAQEESAANGQTEKSTETEENGEAEKTAEETLVQNIAGSLGVETVWLTVKDIDEAKSMVENGEADIALGNISSMTDTKEGALSVSNVYGSGKLYVLTRRGDYSDSPAAFAGRKLGIEWQIDPSCTGVFQTIEQLETITYTDGEDARIAVQNGELDGYVCHLEEGLSLQENDGVQLQNLKNTEAEQYVIVAEAKDVRLLQGINTIIAQYLDGAEEEE